jgi:hypothetical protein
MIHELNIKLPYFEAIFIYTLEKLAIALECTFFACGSSNVLLGLVHRY